MISVVIDEDFFFSIFFFLLFFLLLILAEVRYDTARSSSEDGKGFLTIRVSFGIWSHAGGSPLVALSLFLLARSEANPLTVQNITDLYNLSPGENNKMVIVRPASSVVFFFVSP